MTLISDLHDARHYGKPKSIDITPEMVQAIKRAVMHLEKAWDAMKDFELFLGRDVDGLALALEEFASGGSHEAVDAEMVREILEQLEGK